MSQIWFLTCGHENRKSGVHDLWSSCSQKKGGEGHRTWQGQAVRMRSQLQPDPQGSSGTWIPAQYVSQWDTCDSMSVKVFGERVLGVLFKPRAIFQSRSLLWAISNQYSGSWEVGVHWPGKGIWTAPMLFVIQLCSMCSYSSYIFIAKYYSIVWIYHMLPMNIWVVSRFVYYKKKMLFWLLTPFQFPHYSYHVVCWTSKRIYLKHTPGSAIAEL